MPINIPPYLLDLLRRDNPNVLDQSLHTNTYIPLDLSVHNHLLKSIDVSSSIELGNYIFNYLAEHKAKVGYGGYLEKRGIYNRSENFKVVNQDERDIHLGVDFWAEEGTSVVAPWDGKIHSFRNNVGFGNYGPTIILSHDFDGFKFHTLYGHLSLESLNGLDKGDVIKAGTIIGTLGSPSINGDYPPHLHFQIIYDLEGNSGDYPGVCSLTDLKHYELNCPDPCIFLGLEK